MSKGMHGRELDGAVAKVLGTYKPAYTIPRWDPTKPGLVPGTICAIDPIDVPAEFPDYSTDAATLPEMLAHLQKDYGDIQLRWYEGQGWGAYVYFIDDNDQYADEGGQGATLNEAIARLVLALAATASKPEGKACGGEGQ